MKILVTGGAGFIGSHVVDACLAAGHEVAVVDNLSTGKPENVNPGAQLLIDDIRDPDAMRKLVGRQRPEVICHLAAKVNVRESQSQPLLYAEVNVLGSLALLEAACAAGVRKVIYASTGGAVYGEPRYLPVDEDHPIQPLDPYGASKHHVEHYLPIYRALHSIDYTVLRFPNVYGPRQDPYGEAGVVAIWTAALLEGRRVTINGSGAQERDFVYVGDIARAMVLALTAGGGQIMNLASGVGTSINTLYELLRQATGRDDAPQYGPAKAGEVQRIVLTAERARRVLGWQPKVSLPEGLQRTIAFFTRNA
jgi:UDP-glucose 4-epimerase